MDGSRVISKWLDAMASWVMKLECYGTMSLIWKCGMDHRIHFLHRNLLIPLPACLPLSFLRRVRSKDRPPTSAGSSTARLC